MQEKTFDLTLLNGANGFTITGVDNGGLACSVSSAGDINGDSIDDFVLGAYATNSGNGTSYVLFGTRSGFPAVFNLINLNGSNGFTIPGIAAGGELGFSVSSAGDINGDGLSDVVLGASLSNSATGVSYVIFGSRGRFASSFNLNSLNGTNGFMVPGITLLGTLGFSVSTAGDLNGDGIGDLVVGAYSANSGFGASYILFGNRSGFPAMFNLSNLNGSNGFSILGISSSDYLGCAVNTVGDLNGDNITDLVVAAYGAHVYLGESYVIFGTRGGFPAVFNLANLNGRNGFTIPGIASGGWLGNSVSTAGDVNGDGISDLVLGARAANANMIISYVIFGSQNAFPPSFNLSDLNGLDGFSIPGIVSGESCIVTSGGDVNADGFDDLVLGAGPANSNTGTS